MPLPELSPGGKQKLLKAMEQKFEEFLDQLDPAKIKTYAKDDGNYKKIKYTVLPKGARLQFRSRQRVPFLISKPTWADYSHLLGKKSFLDEDEDYSKPMEYYFGEWLNTIELMRDLTILHIPVDYDMLQAPNVYGRGSANRTRRLTSRGRRMTRIKRNMSITAELEGMVRFLCVPYMREKYKAKLSKVAGHETTICRDGYTMDFFYRFAGSEAKAFKAIQERLWPKMHGFREICLTNVSPATVQLVESVHKPVRMPPAAAAVAE